MSESRSLTQLDPSEYGLIEAAVTESARGRWFLAEFARRNRSADTDVLLQAIGRLENAVTGERETTGDVGRLRGDLMEMADAITRTKLEIAAISPPDHDHSRLFAASESLDAIVRATEHATTDILGAAEEVQEAAWTLRESGAETEICDALDHHATRIYTACSFQDLTAQRISRTVNTLRYLEKRIASMIAIWGAPAEERPDARAGRAPVAPSPELNQSDVDRFIDMNASEAPEQAMARLAYTSATALDEDLAFLPEEDAPEPPASPPETHAQPVAPAKAATTTDDLASAFDDLDSLSIEEKIALFV